MRLLIVILSVFCLFLSKQVFALETEIATDFEKLKGQKGRAILLLQHYSTFLSSSENPLDLKEKTARKIAAILGEGKGVGGFRTKRKATEEEKRVMVQALHAAYQFYPLEDRDFFEEISLDEQIKKHQAILWGLCRTMSVKATQRMYQQEQETKRKCDQKYTDRKAREPKLDPSLAKAIQDDSKPFAKESGTNNLLLEHYMRTAGCEHKAEALRRIIKLNAELEDINNEFLNYKAYRRAASVQMCGKFAVAQQRYQDLVVDKERLKATVRSLLTDSGLREYDSALTVSENLLDLLDSKDSFVNSVLETTPGTFSLNTKPHSMYGGSIFDVVSIYQYNPDLGKTTIAIRRKGGASSKFAPAVQRAIAGLSQVDYDFVFQIGFSDGSPYLLRPHGWTDPTGADGKRNVSAGIFESNGITIVGQGLDVMSDVVHDVHTHGGVASPNNMPLNLPNRNLNPEEFYSFVSVVRDGAKGVVTLHGVGGDFISDDILKIASLLRGNITVGDLFLLMHYSPALSTNPHFLRLLVQWLG